MRNPGSVAPLPGVDEEDTFGFDLDGTIDKAAFLGTPDALIHCAWELDPASTDKNLAGTRRLVDVSRAAGLGQLIFISTLSAHDHAESNYGISKYSAEKEFDQPSDLIVRPGLIIGQGGLFERMMQSTAKFPFVPLFYSGKQKIQYIGVDRLSEGLFNAVEARLAGSLNIAHPVPLDIRAFHSVCAKSLGRKIRFLRLPGPLFLWALRAVEKRFDWKLPISSDNLAGLKKMRVFSTADDLKIMGIEAEDLETILAKL